MKGAVAEDVTMDGLRHCGGQRSEEAFIRLQRAQAPERRANAYRGHGSMSLPTGLVKER